MLKKFPDLFIKNTMKKDEENNIQMKPVDHPVRQEATPIPLHLQENVGTEPERLINRNT